MRAEWIGACLLASALAAQTRTMYPPVRGTHEMAGAANDLEVEAGFRLLTQGGNAVDAGVAAVLTAAVAGQDHFGLGGEIPVLLKMNGQPVAAIGGIGVAPELAAVEFFKSRQPERWEDPGHLPSIPGDGVFAATVPGAFDGLLLALERYGTKSFAEVAAPAIEYANGFPLPEVFASDIKGGARLLDHWPESRGFFLPDRRVTLSPAMVLKDGQPFLALSTPGGDNQDQVLLQVLLDILESGMTPQEAIEAPRFPSGHFYSSFAGHEFVPGRLNLESRLAPPVIAKLKELGHLVAVNGEWSNRPAPTVIMPTGGVLHGAAGPRRGRFIFGR
jgi:gamma-glutamyltranspeptidase